MSQSTPVSAFASASVPSPAAVSALCLVLEQHRRTPEGRIRGAKDFVDSFFPHDESHVEDRLFVHLPTPVRARVVSAWGLRGTKTALRDSPEKTRDVVHDALLAGDLDASELEEGVDPAMLIAHVPLPEWWRFFRGAEPSKSVLGKALVTAHDKRLLDARWLWSTLARGELRGTDVVADQLSKPELGEWMREIHRAGNGSAEGLLAALGWDRFIARTPADALVPLLDALAVRLGLVRPSAPPAASHDDDAEGVAQMIDALVTEVDASVESGEMPRPVDSVAAILLDEEDDEPTLPPQPNDALASAPAHEG